MKQATNRSWIIQDMVKCICILCCQEENVNFGLSDIEIRHIYTGWLLSVGTYVCVCVVCVPVIGSDSVQSIKQNAVPGDI